MAYPQRLMSLDQAYSRHQALSNSNQIVMQAKGAEERLNLMGN
jgi:hypothetical protein